MDEVIVLVELVKALAWPLTTLVIFILLRKQLQTLLPELEMLEWKDFRFRFNRSMQEVSEEAKQVLLSSSSGLETNEIGEDQELARRLELAKVARRAAIIESWEALEKVARDALEQQGSSPLNVNADRSLRLAESLRESDLLNELEVHVFVRMQGLRDAAAHAADKKIDLSSARNFIKTARAFEHRLRSAIKV